MLNLNTVDYDHFARDRGVGQAYAPHLRDDDSIGDVPLKELRNGDQLIIKPGEKILPRRGALKETPSEHFIVRGIRGGNG
ncbi:hypothetical protein [Fodinibius sediminis]|uniref:Uncharacterized protein n=1 Tax=Fodinibius sediminis TaxID=1214077 RepID=A0A521C628_9BACT|nr:hypothetical protein [Fodinibius sediminis]SMO54967.1 hypothetical protein SAMN06265218_10595 [Fodinibius sediminis]